ncbi:transferrin-binding protein-like solute binding protein [Novosphingobium mangrovi (ex Hu et al. 2023)]|uniref:Transferrin-binding protein-like solute binding protein n=1 Tax=Novosphingobium mangrovi (ex Hu et al. 2023) TaxID=2930094 RepID=A0ABT0AG44_9SPHN|nr:transferrin-binding protein-like solute binding protein [Novosphingobium mangrovi (ex Hu et al. 2023)]MCJ1962176.1 transferrin-binding protein-like solute binding protein [Novosphingobium mangrovi (ex Hu et al. 2023)]
MNLKSVLACTTLAGLLAACGGGGSSGGAIGSVPPPPAPTNSSLADLRYDQSFANDAAGVSAVWDMTTGTGVSSRPEPVSLAIAYDADTNGYTISANDIVRTFLPSDIQTTSENETVYLVDDTRLTLITKGYAGDLTTNYVRMGLLQDNRVEGSLQSADLISFTYGLPTNAAATPRSGSAAYATQAFGASTAPGEEPKAFMGAGQIDFDFAQGIFSGHSYLNEYGLVSGSQISGGGIELTTLGQISSQDASLTGTAVFRGWDGTVASALNGSLYGPDGQELGASFSGQNADGMSVTGSIVGQQDSALTPANLSFANMTQEQRFITQISEYARGSLTWQNSETFLFRGYSSDQSGGQFTISDKVDGRANFRTYQKTFDNTYYGTQDVTLELYQTGAANSQLPLTYASFGHWQGSLPASYNGPAHEWFVYGFQTPGYALDNRTGSASYEGVAYGTGMSNSARYDVSGTSRMDVDFGSDTFTGALALNGVETVTNAPVDFGSIAFSGTINSRASMFTGDFQAGGSLGSAISGQFYGLQGQEVAGTFIFNTPDGNPMAGTNVQGAFAATRR